MTRIEFMSELAIRLQGMPESERQDALQFYEEYFDDAGPENEQVVIEELKSPAAVAIRICGSAGAFPPKDREPVQEPAGQPQPSRQESPRWNQGGGQQAYGGQTPPGAGRSTAFWVLVICLSPIWATLLLGVAVTVISLFVAVVAVIFSLAIAMAALLISGIICLPVGFYHLFLDPLNGVYTFSVGLVAVGLAMMVSPGILWLIKKGIPAMSRGIGQACSGVARFFRR